MNEAISRSPAYPAVDQAGRAAAAHRSGQVFVLTTSAAQGLLPGVPMSGSPQKSQLESMLMTRQWQTVPIAVWCFLLHLHCIKAPRTQVLLYAL